MAVENTLLLNTSTVYGSPNSRTKILTFQKKMMEKLPPTHTHTSFPNTEHGIEAKSISGCKAIVALFAPYFALLLSLFFWPL